MFQLIYDNIVRGKTCCFKSDLFPVTYRLSVGPRFNTTAGGMLFHKPDLSNHVFNTKLHHRRNKRACHVPYNYNL